MNILRRINWQLLLVYSLMFAGCVAFWYFVIFWFVICCEKCKREEQAIGKVVWEPEIKGR